jgi:hypothetical protein
MALYHLHLKNISRGKGASAVAAAAYRAGESLWNEAEERASNFAGRRVVRYVEIIAPAGAPAWTQERAVLWNTVEHAEKRRDARLAKEIEVALPRELDPVAKRELVQAFGQALAGFGLVVDVSIHDDGDNHNPHAHLMMTTRRLTAQGFGAKIRGVDAPEFLEQIRRLWAQLANAALDRVGASATIDHRSHAARGISREAGVHRGVDRAERRTKQEARTRAGQMIDQATAAIRAAMQQDAAIRREFPRLAARPDWPPATREPPRDMDGAERAEHRQFWREVDRRHYAEERAAQAPERAPEEPRMPGRREPTREEIERVRDSVRADTMPDMSNTALRQFAAMQERVNQAFAERGVAVENVIDMATLNKELAAFRQTLLDIRMREIDRFDREREEERMLPVPGPDRELVPQGEQETAQQRMLADMQRDVPAGEARAESAAERMLREMAAAERGELPQFPRRDLDREQAQRTLDQQWRREPEEDRER